jgi:hypothetical protein
MSWMQWRARLLPIVLGPIEMAPIAAATATCFAPPACAAVAGQQAQEALLDDAIDQLARRVPEGAQSIAVFPFLASSTTTHELYSDECRAVSEEVAESIARRLEGPATRVFRAAALRQLLIRCNLDPAAWSMRSMPQRASYLQQLAQRAGIEFAIYGAIEQPASTRHARLHASVQQLQPELRTLLEQRTQLPWRKHRALRRGFGRAAQTRIGPNATSRPPSAEQELSDTLRLLLERQVAPRLHTLAKSLRADSAAFRLLIAVRVPRQEYIVVRVTDQISYLLGQINARRQALAARGVRREQIADAALTTTIKTQKGLSRFHTIRSAQDYIEVLRMELEQSRLTRRERGLGACAARALESKGLASALTMSSKDWRSLGIELPELEKRASESSPDVLPVSRRAPLPTHVLWIDLVDEGQDFVWTASVRGIGTSASVIKTQSFRVMRRFAPAIRKLYGARK